MTKPFSREAIMVSNGLEAVEVSQKPDLDLLLIDMNMPVMGGFEAAIIREFNNKIIIIAQTAWNGKDREDAIAAGCSDYI
jgi:CheY-like chemotaxis protein